ncbi:MAG: hypothetical protein KKA79_09285, partial [Nanoarchaeota archaeon]|nr:hypothetical protein [Nanoarchaeota archaeon]
MPEEIQRRLIEDEMKENYVDYAMSVIVSRALPDARDGLKPVHRRILFIMNQLGLQRNKPFRKSATVVGNVMAKLHPHGDSAIYETMVRMAQPFSLRYMLVDGQGNFGCFTKDTKIALTDGRNLSFGELVEEHKKGKKNYTYTINKNGNVEIAEIKNPRLTKKDQKIMKVILDNDEEIKCTLNHKFMLRDEIYNEAQYLKPKISLMPLYLRLSTKKDKLKPSLKGYKMVYQPKTNNWVPCHNLADAWNLKNNVYNKNAGRIRYHVDFNKFNNNPDNLRRIKWEDHWKLHAKHASKLHENEDYRKKIAAGRTKYWLEPENKKVHSRMLSERNKKNWMNPDYREKMCRLLSKVNKEYIKKHPEKRKEFSRRATQTLKKLWKNPIYRLKKSEALKEKWKNLEYRKEQSMRMKGLSDSLWSKQGHREHMSRLAKERWVNDKAFRDYFLNIFSQNGKKSNYNRFLKVCRKTFGLYNGINGKNYEKVRVSYNSRKGAGIIKFDTGLKKFFNNNLESLYQELASTKMNHKVEEIIFLDKREDVYDITIEGTHNFALASGVFVHNSVDGDSAAAMRYCVTGDTLISTNKGVIPIITISNKKEDKINLKILSYDGKKNNAIKFFNSGKHKIIGIETEQGYSIKGSYNHPVLCWTKGFLGKPKLEWKLLES